MPIADSNGCRIYYETFGEGEPMLLVAGQASDRHSWDSVREGLQARHQVITYDHRGTGLSDKPKEPIYTTRLLAADAIAVLDSLEIERAHAYGVSMGGRICQWLGIEHGARVASLILCSTTPGNAHGVAGDSEISEAMTKGFADQEAARLVMSTIFSLGWVATHREVLLAWQEHSPPPFAQALHFQCSEAHDAWALLPTIKNPTLVMHGSADRLNPTANAPLLASAIHDSELRIIDGGLHGAYYERADECNAIVLDFLARHPIQPILEAPR